MRISSSNHVKKQAAQLPYPSSHGSRESSVGEKATYSVHLVHYPLLHGGVNLLKHPRPPHLGGLPKHIKSIRSTPSHTLTQIKHARNKTEEEETLTAEMELSPQLSQKTPSKSRAYRSPPIAPRAGLCLAARPPPRSSGRPNWMRPRISCGGEGRTLDIAAFDFLFHPTLYDNDKFVTGLLSYIYNRIFIIRNKKLSLQ